MKNEEKLDNNLYCILSPPPSGHSSTTIPLILWIDHIYSLINKVRLITSNRSTFEFLSWSTFPVPVCTVLYLTDIWLIKQTINRTSRCNMVDAVRLYASFMVNLLLLKGQKCV